jgi:hypothetical protein
MAYQDRPDLKTQIALNKVAGLTPTLTPAEQKLFAEQQWLESEQKRMAQEKGLPSILGGDVRSYTGSMFAPAGSPMAAVPMPQGAPRVGEMGGGIDVNAYRGSMFGEGVMGAAPILGGSRTQPYNPNATADAILGRAFGKRPAGQVSYAPSTPTAPQTFTQGQQTPRGSIVGANESISMGQQPRMAPSAPILGQSYQGVPDMTGGYEAATPSPISRPSMAAPAPVQQTQPVQPSMLGGAPVSMPQQAPAMAPLLGAFQPGSQEYNYLQQRGAAPQTLGYAAQAASASPYMQQLGMQQQQFVATQQERQTKELVNRAASEYAAGNTGIISQLPAYLQAEAKVLGTKMAQDIAVKPEKVSDFKEAFEIEKNAILESKPPGSTLTAAELSRASQAARGQPSQEQIIAGEVSKMKLKPTEKMVDTDLLKGAAAREVAPALNNLSKLFETTNFKTGSTEPVKAQIRSVLSGLGLPVDEAKLANAQEAMTYFNQLIIPYFQATKGSITDKENALFASMGPQFAKDTTTNKRLLSILSERNKVLLSLEDLANRFGSEDMNPQQYNKQRRDILASYDKKIDTGFGDILRNKPSQSANQEIRLDKATGRRYTKDANGNVVVVP